MVLDFVERVAVAGHLLDAGAHAVLDVYLLSVVLVRLRNFYRKLIVQDAACSGFALGVPWRWFERCCMGLEDDILAA